MGISSVADIVRSRTLSTLSNDLRAQLERSQEELATGRRANIAESNQGRIGDIQLLEKSINDLERQREGIALASNRGAIVQISLEGVTAPLNDLSTRVASAAGLEDEQNLGLAARDARGAIEQIFSSLNTRANGRFVFSGDAINTPALAPVRQFFDDIEAIAASSTNTVDLQASLEAYFNDPAGGFQNDIFTGGTGDAPTLAVGDNERVGFQIKADAPEIRNLLRGLASVVIAGENPENADNFELASQASGTIRTAQDSIAEVRANIGITEARLETLSIRYDSEETILTQLFNDRTARDPFEAATELSDLETRLQTSFLVTARLSELTLANFLR